MIQQMDILFEIKNGKKIVLESLNDLLVFFILHYNMQRTTGAMDIDIFFYQLFKNIKNETLNGTNVNQRWWKVSQSTSLSLEKMNSIEAFLMLYASVYFLRHTKRNLNKFCLLLIMNWTRKKLNCKKVYYWFFHNITPPSYF